MTDPERDSVDKVTVPAAWVVNEGIAFSDVDSALEWLASDE